jgi:hypothetical protein
MSLVEGNTNGNDVLLQKKKKKGSRILGHDKGAHCTSILVDCILHREIVQLVCEHDPLAVSNLPAPRLLMNKP